jgi:hypothetical protein
MTPQHETELIARVARLERILSKYLDKRRECSIMEIAEIEDARGETRTLLSHKQRKYDAQQGPQRQG